MNIILGTNLRILSVSRVKILAEKRKRDVGNGMKELQLSSDEPERGAQLKDCCKSLVCGPYPAKSSGDDYEFMIPKECFWFLTTALHMKLWQNLRKIQGIENYMGETWIIS